MQLIDLPNDLIIQVCHQVFTEEIRTRAIDKLKENVLADISENKLEDAVEIEFVICRNIMNLSHQEKDRILCEYGIMKAIMLFHDYRKNGLGDNAEEICEFMEDDNFGMIDGMIELILKDEIPYDNNWRINTN